MTSWFYLVPSSQCAAVDGRTPAEICKQQRSLEICGEGQRLDLPLSGDRATVYPVHHYEFSTNNHLIRKQAGTGHGQRRPQPKTQTCHSCFDKAEN